MNAMPQDPGATSALDSSLGFRLSRLARRLRHAWTEALDPLELSPPQAAVLRGVAGSPGSSVRAVARRLGADPMNVKRCVDVLEARGLLASGHDPSDRRPRTLAVTPAGAEVAHEVERLAAAQDAWLTEALPADLAGALGDGLGRLEALLGPDRLEGVHDEPGPRRSARGGVTSGACAASDPGSLGPSGAGGRRRASGAGGAASPVAGGAR